MSDPITPVLAQAMVEAGIATPEQGDEFVRAHDRLVADWWRRYMELNQPRGLFSRRREILP